jgi:hypothetical protein
MEDQRFDEPVQVMLGGPGKIRVVTSTTEAAECLLKYRWPRGTGKKHRSARQACLDVLAGLRQAAEARKAFVAAAIESDILVGNGATDNPVSKFLAKSRGR